MKLKRFDQRQLSSLRHIFFSHLATVIFLPQPEDLHMFHRTESLGFSMNQYLSYFLRFDAYPRYLPRAKFPQPVAVALSEHSSASDSIMFAINVC